MNNIKSNNGTQNIGICYKFAVKNVPFKLTAVFMRIVDQSFGRTSEFTPRYSMREWGDMLHITKDTFNSQVKQLEALGLVKINKQSSYLIEGGSEAYSYSPVFPEGYGEITIDK